MGTNRRTLVTLAIVAVVFFAITEIAGEHHGSFRNTIGDITWFGFLLSVLALIVVAVLMLVRGRRRTAR
jgi:hypothetical protein